MKPPLHSTITIQIERIGINGEGVGSLDGFTMFVHGALPGEMVRAKVVELRKNFGRAHLVELVKTSPHRVKAPCPVFGRCGGCQLMHLSYTQQLETKRQRVVDALKRIGKIDVDVLPCVPSPQPLYYRNKIQLPYKDATLGLYAFNSHDLVEIEKCYILCDLGEKMFEHVKVLVKKHAPELLRHVVIKTAISTNQMLVVLVTYGGADVARLASEIKQAMPEIKGVVQNINDTTGNVILSRVYRTLEGEGVIYDEICGLKFKVSPASFFQVNPAQAENLYTSAVDACELQGNEIVLDAYCGVGTLSLLLAKKAKKVIGIESVPEAIDDAKENARLNQISNATFTCGMAEELIETLDTIDVAVINPPRKGCEPLFLTKLMEMKPRCLIYVSCDPATLARDLAILQTGGYKVISAQPFDMFPQTVHVETLAICQL